MAMSKPAPPKAGWYPEEDEEAGRWEDVETADKPLTVASHYYAAKYHSLGGDHLVTAVVELCKRYPQDFFDRNGVWASEDVWKARVMDRFAADMIMPDIVEFKALPTYMIKAYVPDEFLPRPAAAAAAAGGAAAAAMSPQGPFASTSLLAGGGAAAPAAAAAAAVRKGLGGDDDVDAGYMTPQETTPGRYFGAAFFGAKVGVRQPPGTSLFAHSPVPPGAPKAGPRHQTRYVVGPTWADVENAHPMSHPAVGIERMVPISMLMPATMGGCKRVKFGDVDTDMAATPGAEARKYARGEDDVRRGFGLRNTPAAAAAGGTDLPRFEPAPGYSSAGTTPQPKKKVIKFTKTGTIYEEETQHEQQQQQQEDDGVAEL